MGNIDQAGNNNFGSHQNQGGQYGQGGYNNQQQGGDEWGGQ